MKLPASSAAKRPMWDGSFPTHRLHVAKELEAGSVGYGANGKSFFLFAAYYHIIILFLKHFCVSFLARVGPGAVVE